jgi:class 3 adenylate cyclase
LIVPNPEHLAAMAAMGLEMQESVRKLNGEFPGLTLRIGLHVGSVIAGVIGIRKFIYDVWGDAVNIASRLESHGAPGRIHVSDAVFQRLKGRYAFEPRGTIELKGRGPMQTYFLDGPAS